MKTEQKSYNQLLKEIDRLKYDLKQANQQIRILQNNSADLSTLKIINSLNEAANKKTSDDFLINLLLNLLEKYFKRAGIPLYEIFRIIGVDKKSELEFDLVISMIHPDDRTRIWKIINSLFVNSTSKKMEFRITRPDKSLRFISQSTKVERNEKGKVIKIFGKLQDITKRKKAEIQLKENEEKFSTIFNQSPIAISLLNFKNKKFFEVNNAFESIFEYKKRELIGFTPDEINLFLNHEYKKILNGVKENKSDKHESIVGFKKKSGDKGWAILKGELINLRGVNYILLMMIDITEKRNAEIALFESENTLRSFFKSTPWLLGIVDATETDIIGVYFNKESKRYWGQAPEYLMGSTIRLGMPENLIKLWIKKLKKSGIIKKPVHFEYEYETKNKTRIYSATVNFIHKISESKERYSLVIEDITERKESEKEILKSHIQMRLLAANIQNAREEERTGIAREIHDELGQVLTAVKLDLSWLKSKMPEHPSTVDEKIISSLQLVDDSIQTVKRITAELRPGILDDLGLAAAIEWQCEEFQKRSEIKIDLQIIPDNIYLNPKLSTAIFRISQEALTNIARHSKATKVCVRLVKEDDRLELMIKDNGIGITREQQDDSKSFGLLGIKERADYFGGNTCIKGIKSRGTTIIVQFPINEPILE